MIHVVVVESHHHALEHIHTILRQRRLLNNDWSMLHFDSHADLACPGVHIPAIACYRPQMSIPTAPSSKPFYSELPVVTEDCDVNSDSLVAISDADDNDNDSSTGGKNLYELLDTSSSGIAEWILPLVLAANLRSIRWVRPPNTVPLIPMGDHLFHVGVHCPINLAHKATTLTTGATATKMKPKSNTIPTSFLDLPLTATVKVDWYCKYYVEDDSYVAATELIHTQPLHLTVVEGPLIGSVCPSGDNHSNIHATKNIDVNDNTSRNLYAIDICLDYFSCYNPFLKDIELQSSTYAKALYDVVIQSKLYKQDCDTTQLTTNFTHELCTYRKQLTEILTSLQNVQRNDDLSAVVTSLLPFYDNPQIAFEYFDRLQNALIDYDGTAEEYRDLIQMSIEAIPYLTMPHSTLTVGEMDESTTQERLHFMRDEILSFSSGLTPVDTRPLIITIARSAEDGFTPYHMVDHLQDIVLSDLHSMYCGCSNPMKTTSSSSCTKTGHTLTSNLSNGYGCRLNLLFDYQNALCIDETRG